MESDRFNPPDKHDGLTTSMKEVEVIDLTGDTDPKGSVAGEESSVIKQTENLPAFEEALTSLTLIEQGFSPSQQ